MEVHHHSHTDGHRGHRKKWTHYFWEFFMLFLAVFCGFLAENQREHYIEHQREKKYMVSLLENLDADTKVLNRYFDLVEKQKMGLDTLIKGLRSPLTEKRGLAAVYVYYLKYGQNTLNVYFNENTIVQLKNAGGFRIIRRENVINTLNEYERIKSIVIKDKDEISKLINELERNHANAIFDFTNGAAINKLSEVPPNNLNTDSLITVAMNDTLVLLNNTQNIIPVFRNTIRSLKSLTASYSFWIDRCREKNRELSEIIKKEYKLK